MASSIAYVLVISIGIGYGIGYVLTRYVHAPDWVMSLCVLFGVIAGFVEMIRMALEASKDDE
ncbi:MAG TPA: AtpZ/AtpI family protein [Armatimonadota bacterium]